ncbi:hypothetical protein NFI96_002986 [Prochilodus magdalenae]|nr:hypothetical protein NFI96_002986 [Prochilodus magdalenae]
MFLVLDTAFKGEVRIRKKKADDDNDQTDVEEIMGGYDPAVRQILAKAEERGDKVKKKEKSDEAWSSSTQAEEEEDGWRMVMEIERSIDQCLSYVNEAINLDSQKALEKQLKELERQKKELRKKGSKKVEKKCALRSTNGETPDKMCPVIVRGQSLEYKPWLNTDMSDILEKLPTLQEGAHPWISKLEELMVGTQPAVGDIKRLLANLLGVPAMGEILQSFLLRLEAPRQETSTLQKGDAEGSGEPRGDWGQCGEEEMQDECQSQPPEEDMVHGGGIINDSVCACNDARSDATDGDEQEGNFGN